MVSTSSTTKGDLPLPEPLTVPVVDDHTHLNFEDRPHWEDGKPLPGLDTATRLLDLAESVGVKGVVQVGTNVADSRWAAELADADHRVLAAVAVHPNDAPLLAADGALDAALEAIDALAARERVRAVGETGLDVEKTGEDGYDAQLASFEAHIAIAKRHALAMQIHDRGAHEAVLATLERLGAPDRTVLHCFSGDADFARRAVDAGLYLSFAGTVTFKNAAYLREALAVTPLERILVETDSPFLTPHPYRGRTNSSYAIPYTLRLMAETLGLDVAELGAQVAANAVAVYGEWG